MSRDAHKNEDRDLVERAVTEDLFGSLLGPTEAVLGETLKAASAPLVAPEKYDVIEPIGFGGFGTVYRAHDRSLGRDIALKFLTNARPDDIERFRREARFTARLHDPNIVQVYELGEHERVPYIAMQLVRGVHLGETSLDLDALLQVMRKIAGALGSAHAQGIVHRDLKPENILIDESGTPFLSDFGIARDLLSSPGESLSIAGTIVGTPAMMSPEQARGEIHAIDARSDIYAFGATLYYMSTGQPPFHGDTTVDVLHAVIHKEPVLPRSLRPQIPLAVETLIMRCLRKRKSARYQRVSEVVAEIDKILAGDSGAVEGGAWFRRLVGAGQTPPPNSRDDDDGWQQALEFSKEISSWSVHLYRVRGDLTPSYRKLDSVVERLEDILREHPDWAWARLYRGMALRRRGRLEEALDDLERAIDRVKDREEAFFELGRVYLALYLEKHHEAQKHLTEVGVDHRVTQARATLEKSVRAFEACTTSSGDLSRWQHRFVDAVAKLSERDVNGCVALCDKILAEDPDLEEVWKLRGDALRFHGGDPVSSYQRAVEIRRSYVEAYVALGEVLAARERFDESRNALDRATTIAPDLADAFAERGAVDLSEARLMESQGADRDAMKSRLSAGQEFVAAAIGRFPNSYALAVTRIGLCVAMGRTSGDEQPLNEALAAIETARTLPGCQNRVNMLHASALLERARIHQAKGQDATDDLARILQYPKDMPSAPVGSPDWQRVLDDARQLSQSQSNEDSR